MHDENPQDVELLKLTLPLMSRHAAGYHPLSYSVWYEYARNLRPELRSDVDEEIRRQERLSHSVTFELYSKHLVEPAERALITARTNLLGLVEQVDQAVNEADRDTAGFDSRLSEFRRALSSASTLEDLDTHVSSMQQETQRVGEGFGKLSTQLDQSKNEVRRLTEELQQMREEAQTDPLSGLLNRRGFDREVRRLATVDGIRESSLSIIMIDIDHFKKVNDTYGHPLGDRVIAAVGQLIRDSLGDLGVAARYGGEEFAALLPAQPPQVAEQVARSILQRVASGKIRRRQGEDPIGGVTVSAGVASKIRDEDPASLIERADRALYQSKSAGRNRVTVAS